MTSASPLGTTHLTVRRRILIGMWVALVIAMVIWTHFETPGWDLKVYVAAIHSLRVGHDPYADAMVAQQA